MTATEAQRDPIMHKATRGRRTSTTIAWRFDGNALLDPFLEAAAVIRLMHSMISLVVSCITSCSRVLPALAICRSAEVIHLVGTTGCIPLLFRTNPTSYRRSLVLLSTWK